MTTITVYERNDAAVTITLEADVTAADDYEVYVKERESDDDDDAIATYTESGGAVTVTGQTVDETTLDVQMDADDLATPGRYVWRIDTLTGGRRLTRLAGTFVIKGI